MKKVFDKIKSIFKIQQIRFLFVGGLNTIVGYGTYAILILLNVNYLLANTISTIIGIIHSYIWNRNFTFKSNNNVKTEILKFISVYLLSYLIGMFNIFILVSKFDLNKYIAGLINLIITTLVSWFGHKYFSFRRLEK